MRVVLTLLLLVANVPVWAAWVKVVDMVAIVSYVDPATLQKEGNIHRVWKQPKK